MINSAALAATLIIESYLGISTAYAQNNTSRNLIDGIQGNIKQQNAKKEWLKPGGLRRTCVDTVFSQRNNNLRISTLVQKGIFPSDRRLSKIMKFCDKIIATKLKHKADVPCVIRITTGRQKKPDANKHLGW